MTPSALELAAQALWLATGLAAPLVVAAAAVGVLMAIVQTAIQVQEAAVSFAARWAVVCIVLVVGGPIAWEQLLAFSRAVWRAATVIGAP